MYYLSKSLILIRKINIQGGETGVLQGGRKYTLSYLEMNRRCHHVGKSTHTKREKSQAIVFSSKLGLKISEFQYFKPQKSIFVFLDVSENSCTIMHKIAQTSFLSTLSNILPCEISCRY